MEKIAFIGLEHLGRQIAEDLIKAGHPLQVYDNNPALTQLFAGNASHTIAEAIADADIIFTMLSTEEEVQEVFIGSEGVLNLAKKDAILIDLSSTSIATTQKLHALALENHIPMLDAPVSGALQHNEEKILMCMVGGEAADFSRMQPIIARFAKKIIYVGEAGSGQAAHICTNLILGISMIAVSEGFALAQALGLDMKKFFAISSNTPSQCWAMTHYCPTPGVISSVPANHNYKPGLCAEIILRDLMLGLNASQDVNVSMPLGGVAAELYTLYVNQGYGKKDFSGIISFFIPPT